MSGGHAVVECIRREGVRHVFGVPGESYMAALDGFFDTPEITLITNRQEGGACYMAEAYAKATRSTGVCFVTRGPGATNASIGVHCAAQDSTPLVLLVGQVPRRLRGREAFQEVDYGRFFGSMAKWVVEIDAVEKIADLLPRAFRVARSGRPGPVVVSLPEDMLAEQGEFRFSEPVSQALPHPDPAAIAQVVKRIAAAEKPLLLVGGGVQFSRARKELVAFAERFQVPVCTAWRRLDAFPNSHPHYVGSVGIGPGPTNKAIAAADLLVVVGDRLDDITTAHYTLIPEGQTLVQIDADADALGRNYAPALAVVADPGLALQAALEQPAPAANPGRAGWIADHRKAWEAYVVPPERPSRAVPMERAMTELNAALPADAILTVDAGNSTAWVQRYRVYDAEDSFFGPGVGSMGYGLPAAIGANLAHPERVVVGTCGDGGYLMTGQELAPAVQYGIDIVQIVFNNGSLGTIRMHQEKDFPGRTHATDLKNPDFAALAEAFGARGFRVERPEQFLPALTEALACGRPALIEVLTDVEVISVGTTITELRGKGAGGG
ncbi:MAG: thiamine pyrophosphate-dependent enzyme [bacterium]